MSNRLMLGLVGTAAEFWREGHSSDRGVEGSNAKQDSGSDRSSVSGALE